MRMRKKPNLLPRMERAAQVQITDPENYPGLWREKFPGYSAVHLELGCGKGGFICIEPQAGMVNGLNYPAPEGHRVVEPGKSIDFSATISYNK